MTIRNALTILKRSTALPRRTRGGRGFFQMSARVLVFALVISGCSTTKSGRHYNPRTMPADLLVQKRDNVQTLDLTQLARSSKDSDVLDRGDLIEVTIAAGLDDRNSVTVPVRINEQGIANIPEVGQVSLAGLETESAEATITTACIDRQLYRKPSITVTMKQQRMNKVLVIGAVKKPGTYELPRGNSDLLAAIYAAEGLEDDAGTTVEIRNPSRAVRKRPDAVASKLQPGVNPAGHTAEGGGADSPIEGEGPFTTAGFGSGSMESVHVDLVSATKSKSGEYLVEDGGVVRVEKRDPEPVYIIGLVHKPDKYDFPISDDLRVTDAIAMAGGTSLSLADKIFVVRHVPNSSESAVIQVSLREAKRNAQANVRLEPGDVVSVENTPATAIWETLNVVRFIFSGALLPTSGLF